jgi:hypothetical protein
MADWKYVMFEVNGQKVPIIFPGTLVHADVTRAILGSFTLGEDHEASVVSAGGIPALQVIAVEGRSTTMNIESKPEDASTINTYPYNHGREATIPMDDMIGLRFCQLMMEKLNA